MVTGVRIVVRKASGKGGFPDSAIGKEPTCPCRRCKRHGFDPWVGKIVSNVLAWRIPWTEEPGGSAGLHRVGHGRSNLAHWRRHSDHEQCGGILRRSSRDLHA